VVLTVVGPVELALSGFFDGIASIPEHFRNSSGILQKNAALVAERQRLRSENDILRIQIANRDSLIAQLSELKPFLSASVYQVLPAEIVSKSPVRATGAAARTMTIGIGSQAGVRRNDLVVMGADVVGEVTTVGSTVSQVRLITDVDCRIVVRTAPGGVEGMLRGYSADRCLMDRVDARAPVKVGDFVVTSGFEGMHPANLLIGTVEKVERMRNPRLLYVEVKPAADFDRLAQVIVVRRRQSPQ
jgi:rod shape-determining protein MreC